MRWSSGDLSLVDVGVGCSRVARSGWAQQAGMCMPPSTWKTSPVEYGAAADEHDGARRRRPAGPSGRHGREALAIRASYFSVTPAVMSVAITPGRTS